MGQTRSIWWKIPGILIWMAAAGLAAYNFTSSVGLLAVLLGVLAAFAIAGQLDRLPIRLPRLWLISGATLGAVILLGILLRSSDTAAKLLGSAGVYTAAEFSLWLALPATLLTALLLSTTRYSLFLSIEASLLVGIFASVFAAHREGSLHRPYFITDRLLERNWDPLPFFLGFGAALGVLLVIWLLSRRSAKRTLLDPLILMAIIIGMFLALPDGKVRQLNAWAASGSGDEKRKAEQEKGGGGGSGKGGQKQQEKEQNGGRNQDPDPSNGSGGKNFPVAVVNLHDDYTPPYGMFYFRQDALSTWNGKRLIRDASQKLDTDVGVPFPAEAVEVPMRDRADTERQPNGKRLAHRMRTTVALMTPHSKPFALIDAAKFEPATNPDPKRFERAYKTESIVLDTDFSDLLHRPVGSEKWSPEVWQHYTQVPDDPRYRKIADEARQLLPPHLRGMVLAQALAIKFWLDKNTTYDLGVARPNDEADPVAGFLFGDRRGYCVHLAHSAAYLFRTIGLPSRVSVGYAVDARQRGSGSAVLIRNGDAHAWPEIYVKGLGWVVLDITPEKVATPPQQDKADPELQRMLGEMARQTPGSPKEENPPPGDGDVRKAIVETLQAMGRMLLPLAAMTLVALYMMKIWRRMEPRFCTEARLPVSAYRSALDSLADLGFRRGFGASREHFAESIAASAPEFDELTQIHLRHSLGAGNKPRSRAVYLALSRAVARKVANGVPFWRRAAGALHPLSWWKVS
ncbi:MAG: transglutaminase domain-containing protein [Acidobacteria bacterium]|nr:transglutaminase domain-containing protein [Acidobacteriota bacterium]